MRHGRHASGKQYDRATDHEGNPTVVTQVDFRGLSLQQALAVAVNTSGYTLTRIAAETGLHLSGLSRFVAGKRGMSLPNLETLMRFMGLALTWTHRAPADWVAIEGEKNA